ncbi:MAG: ROK family protein [Mycoplasmoidaceae bacterium]
MKILSIDIGGTTTKFAIICSETKKILKKYDALKTQKGNSLKWLFEYFNKNINETYEVISICIPGFFSKEKQMVISAFNLGYKNFKIIDECKKYSNKKVFVTNDANAASLGEYWKSNLKYNNVIFYTIGTGIGGAIIIDKNIYEGSLGFAGEFGHGPFLEKKTKCNCGNEHCIEPLSSATGITNNLILNAKNNQNTELGKLYKLDPKNFSIEKVIPLIKKNNKLVIKSLKYSLTPLVNHIVVMIYALNPDAVFIGGGPSKLGNDLINIIKSILKENKNNSLIKYTKILISKHGNDSALYGCVYNVLSNLKSF